MLTLDQSIWICVACFAFAGILYLVKVISFKRGYHKRNEELVKEFGQEYRHKLLMPFPNDELAKLDELTKVLEHLGYTIHHLGNDLAFNSKSGVVSLSTPSDIKQNNGHLISQVGNYFRCIALTHSYGPFKDKSPIEVAQLFYNAIDSKLIEAKVH